MCLAFVVIGITQSLAQETRIDLRVALHRPIADALLVIRIQSGADEFANTRTFPVSTNGTELLLDIRGIPQARPGELIFVHGRLSDSAQQTIGYMPLSFIDLRDHVRREYVTHRTETAETTADTLQRSFPLRGGLRTSLQTHNVGDVLNGTRIALIEKWITQSDEWDRITSDYLMELPIQLTRDSAKVATAFRFLEEYVSIAENQRLDNFYVEFLLKMKRAGIGGAIVGTQTLNDIIFSSLTKMFADRMATISHWSANTLRTYRETSTVDRSHECIDLATLLINALNAAIARGDLDVVGEQSLRGDVMSMQQAATECAQAHFVAKAERASRVDVRAAAAFLAQDEKGPQFMHSYIMLFETMEGRGLMPRRPTGPSKPRIEEIQKYYDEFHAAVVSGQGEGT